MFSTHIAIGRRKIIRGLALRLVCAAAGAAVMPVLLSGSAWAQGNATTTAATGTPLYFGVSGPLTGVNAQYGAQWKAGFDLALDQINAEGGIKGRPLNYIFEDSQSDPRQAVSIAQKFVSDPRILIELGDFSSTASMAASPIYQRAGLVQLGFTNSHPDFTKTGDYIWSPAISQADEQPKIAELALSQGIKRVAVLYQNTDWGRTSEEVFAKSTKALGGEVVAAEGYLPTDKDFRATLVRIQSAHPDGIVLISYYTDGAQIVRQARENGIRLPIVASSSVYSPKFVELGGDAVNGVVTHTNFFAGDPRPEVQRFVQAFQAKYHRQPDSFNAVAYDATFITAYALRAAGADRRAIRDELPKLRNVPSVIFGSLQFDPTTRRVSGAPNNALVLKHGQWDLLKPPAAVASR